MIDSIQKCCTLSLYVCVVILSGCNSLQGYGSSSHADSFYFTATEDVGILYSWDNVFGGFSNRQGVVARTSLGGKETVHYRFGEKFGVNELLKEVANLDADVKSNVEVYFSYDLSCTEPKTLEEVQYDWSITVFDESVFDPNRARLVWRAEIAIDQKAIDLLSLEIPFGLIVQYQSKLTHFIEFHNQRMQDEDLIPRDPTTARMVWPAAGRFSDD